MGVNNNKIERTGMNASYIFTSQQGQRDLESPTAVNLECSQTVSYTTKSGHLHAPNKIELSEIKKAVNKVY